MNRAERRRAEKGLGKAKRGVSNLEHPMPVYHYTRFFNSAKAFRQTAEIADARMKQTGVSDESDRVAWEAITTASLYVFGVSLELFMKCLVSLNGKNPTDGHGFARLYDLLPEEIGHRLASAMPAESVTEIAYMTTNKRPDKPMDGEDEAKPYRGLFVWFDRGLDLVAKRYAWEKVAEKEWIRYVEDMSPLLKFLNNVEVLTKKALDEYEASCRSGTDNGEGSQVRPNEASARNQ